MAHGSHQLAFPARPTWGGRRAGAGRKPAPGRRPGVAHVTRPLHHAGHPVHVTIRTGPTIRCLRSVRVFPSVRRALVASSRRGFRVVHFSVQDDHLHLIVEADDRATLARGVRGLAIRVARAVNRALDRRGAVCADRYHARALTSPRAVRHALIYVFDEPPQALRGRTRPGPVLVGAVVHWLAECAGDAARAATRRRRAHMAGRRRLASPWSHRWCNRVPKNQTPMPEGTPRPP